MATASCKVQLAHSHSSQSMWRFSLTGRHRNQYQRSISTTPTKGDVAVTTASCKAQIAHGTACRLLVLSTHTHTPLQQGVNGE